MELLLISLHLASYLPDGILDNNEWKLDINSFNNFAISLNTLVNLDMLKPPVKGVYLSNSLIIKIMNWLTYVSRKCISGIN